MQLSEKKYAKRLKDFGLSLTTTYKSGDNIVEKNSFETLKTNIVNGIRIEKNYLRGGKSLFKLHNFDPRIKYTFVNPSTAQQCPNCGADIDASSGECPYCGTAYNMDYESKAIGAKYHTDLVMNTTTYKTVAWILAFATAFIISFVYIKTTGRTFNGWDFAKVLTGTALFGLAFYYLFYYLDSFFILLPVKIYKEKINAAQEKFWAQNAADINKDVFFTNLNYELQKYYFEGDNTRNVLDFDLVDYTTIERYGDEVTIDVLVREVIMDAGKVKSRQKSQKIRLKRAKIEHQLVKVGGVALHCRNCGTSMDAFQKTCPSCGTPHNYLQEWYMVG
ncbi:MAG: zinc ribbon domain-containing protein [Bacteroidales bacterium]|nr:zinc ribbon domain-containing protein [Bacteroidales bacterium]